MGKNATQVWQPKIDPQHQCQDGRREVAPQSCPLCSNQELWHTHTHTATTTRF